MKSNKEIKEFELKVKHYCVPEDFEKNKTRLKELKVTSYDTFINLLIYGGEIVPSVRACEEIYKLNRETGIEEDVLLHIIRKGRIINFIVDEKLY